MRDSLARLRDWLSMAETHPRPAPPYVGLLAARVPPGFPVPRRRLAGALMGAVSLR